jgi:murein L,D-transpeptidase YcbB/YkuD
MTRSCPWIDTFVVVFLVTVASGCQERNVAAGGGASEYSEPQPNAALRSFVEGKALDAAWARPEMPTAERVRLVDQVRRIYRDHNYRLIWIDGNRLSERYHQFSKALDAADDHGLPRALYAVPIEDLPGNRMEITAEQAPQLDAKITAAFLRYFTHLAGGRLDPRSLQSLWTLKPEKPDLVAALSGAMKTMTSPP